ncbi:MAG: multidrug transporter [Bulleidia sp.]
MDITKKDWKLYREKLPDWQEAYMEKLIRGYQKLLRGSGYASEKFWELDKRLRNDKKNPGVRIQVEKETMIQDLALMVHKGVITMDDLAEFSEGVRDAVDFFLR